MEEEPKARLRLTEVATRGVVRVQQREDDADGRFALGGAQAQERHAQGDAAAAVDRAKRVRQRARLVRLARRRRAAVAAAVGAVSTIRGGVLLIRGRVVPSHRGDACALG